MKVDFYKIDQEKVIHENDDNINDFLNSFYKTLTETPDHHFPSTKKTKTITNSTLQTLDK